VEAPHAVDDISFYKHVFGAEEIATFALLATFAYSLFLFLFLGSSG